MGFFSLSAYLVVLGVTTRKYFTCVLLLNAAPWTGDGKPSDRLTLLTLCLLMQRLRTCCISMSLGYVATCLLSHGVRTVAKLRTVATHNLVCDQLTKLRLKYMRFFPHVMCTRGVQRGVTLRSPPHSYLRPNLALEIKVIYRVKHLQIPCVIKFAVWGFWCGPCVSYAATLGTQSDQRFSFRASTRDPGIKTATPS